MHAAAYLLERIVERGGFMIGRDAGDSICRELLIGKGRAVAVDHMVLEECELGEHRWVGVDDRLGVHHLTESEDALVSEIGTHVIDGEGPAVVVEVRCGHA